MPFLWFPLVFPLPLKIPIITQAWVSGFFDDDRSIRVNHRRGANRTFLILKVTQCKSPTLLVAIQNLYPGFKIWRATRSVELLQCQPCTQSLCPEVPPNWHGSQPRPSLPSTRLRATIWSCESIDWTPCYKTCSRWTPPRDRATERRHHSTKRQKSCYCGRRYPVSGSSNGRAFPCKLAAEGYTAVFGMTTCMSHCYVGVDNWEIKNMATLSNHILWP